MVQGAQKIKNTVQLVIGLGFDSAMEDDVDPMRCAGTGERGPAAKSTRAEFVTD